MENGISRWEFWTGVLIALAPYLYQFYSRFRDSRDKDKQLESTEELTYTEAWERLLKEYSRQIESLKKLETENAELRPLVLKMALLEQEMKQLKEDKEDWKRFSGKLQSQIEELGHIPLPFRRTPQDGDTGERMKVSRKMKTIQEETQALVNSLPEKDRPATVEAPTIVRNPQAGE